MDKNAMSVYINLLAKSHVFGNPVRLDYEKLSSQTGFSIAICKYLIKRLIRERWVKPVSYYDEDRLLVYNVYERKYSNIFGRKYSEKGEGYEF